MRRLVRYGLVSVVVLFLAQLGTIPAGADSSAEFDAWNAIQRSPSDQAIVSFLTTYPESPFRDKAAAMLAELRGTSPADVLDQYGASRSPQYPTTEQAAPAPASKQESPKLVGTFTRSHQEKYEDNSGYFEWEDELVMNADGTADLTVKYKVHLRSDWYWSLRGCESSTNYSSSPRIGTYRWKRKYTVTAAATSVTLQPQGPAEVSWVDPYCWQHGAGTGEDKSWVLNWAGGRLSDDDGDYARKY